VLGTFARLLLNYYHAPALPPAQCGKCASVGWPCPDSTLLAHIESVQTSLLVAGPVTEQQNHAAAELYSELVQEGAAAQEKRDVAIRERKQQSAVERQQAAKDGVGHEAGSIAADRRRHGELERQGRFTTTDPLAGLSARPSRNAGKLLTDEQLR
jgi:hypothetical protein